MKYLDYSQPQYVGWDAKIVYEAKRKERIVGYYIEIPKMKIKNKMELWTHKFDDTCLIFHQNRNTYVTTGFLDISAKDEQIKWLEDDIEKAKEAGAIVKKLQ